MSFSGGHIIWLTAWALAVPLFIEYLHSKNMHQLQVPWLPVSLVGTAVAFYVGFKNNSSYDRLWEARKIWGAIVNSSRMWGSTVLAFVSNQFRNEHLSDHELKSIHERLIYRHIAWLYSLRSQLLIPTQWEHINQGRLVRYKTESSIRTFGVGLFEDEITKYELPLLLPEEEIERMINSENTATQIINQQAQDLKLFRNKELVDDFRHMELQKILNDLYVHQGQAERIKKFPLPRQYGSMSFVFVGLFIFLLPFGLVTVFHDLSDWGAWLSIPFTVIVGWVFLMMELIGDYSENPFEGLPNDIPMMSICRTIEIDLKQMLGETDLPEAIQPMNDVLL
jgi:ion channel-forming bestrophin family protein